MRATVTHDAAIAHAYLRNPNATHKSVAAQFGLTRGQVSSCLHDLGVEGWTPRDRQKQRTEPTARETQVFQLLEPVSKQERVRVRTYKSVGVELGITRQAVTQFYYSYCKLKGIPPLYKKGRS